MTAILSIISLVFIWNAGLADWMVAYATGIAQLGVWLTLLSYIPFSSLWVSLKQMPFSEIPIRENSTHWRVLIKLSFFSYFIKNFIV